jgi:hypothetical protein
MKISITYGPGEYREMRIILAFLRSFVPTAKIREKIKCQESA